MVFCLKCVGRIVDKVTGFKLRPTAKQDLAHIWRGTVETWSIGQADRYVRELNDAFGLLVEQPKMARERPELSPPLRVLRSGSHMILYQIVGDHIDIVRIRHVREDWLSDPLGEEKG